MSCKQEATLSITSAVQTPLGIEPLLSTLYLSKIFNYRFFDIYRIQALRAANIYYFAIVTGTIFAETSVTAVW